jgi:cobalt-zinc-cadmium efflux system outer membrane protein
VTGRRALSKIAGVVLIAGGASIVAPSPLARAEGVAADSNAKVTAPGSAFGVADPAPATESQVLDEWLRQGRELTSVRTKIGSARFDVLTATVWANPSVSVSADLLASGSAVNGNSGFGPQLSVALPIFGQIEMRRAEATANLRVAEVEVLDEIWERSADVEAAMLDRAFADAEVQELEHNLRELERISRIVSTRAAAGANSVYDTLRVSTTEATFRAGLATATTERERAEAKLLSLVAVPGLKAAPVTREGMLAFLGPENERALIALARQRRPDLELARRGVLAAQASAARYRREVAPIPTVSFGPYFTQVPTSVYLQGSISVPIPLFDRNQGPIGHALTQADGQRALAEAIEQRIGIEVHGAWQARERARDALKAFREGGLKATDELVARAEVSYQAGTFAILDLLDAYRAVWDARAQALELEKAFAEAEAELEHAAVLLPMRSSFAADSH